MNSIICNLNGYLHSLRRLSGNACDFWATTFVLEDGLEKSLFEYFENNEVEVDFNKKSVVNYRDIDAILQTHVFSKLAVNDESLFKLFAWDIMEFLQMSYRGIEPEIDPVYNGEAFMLNAKSEYHSACVYLVIPIENQAVIVGFASRV